MKAVQVVGYGRQLEMTELPAPEVTGPFDVIVRIGGAGVCRTDIHILEGQWAEKSQVTLPYTIGHENAGWVHAVGSAVTNVAEGDKVIVHPLITCGLCRACRFGDDVHCENSQFPGIDTAGGYAEYLRTSARSVVKIDDSLEPADVAALADAGLTAYHAAAKAARRLRAGDRCVVIGAGGLGHIGIQVMKAISPAELIVVDRNPDAVKLAESIGADRGIVADGTHVDAVLELTGGLGAETVIDFVGEGGSTDEGIRMLRQAGDYHVVGYGENIDVPTIDIISAEINIIGNLVGSYNDLVELMALAAQQRVQLHTSKYRLDQFQDALDDLNAGSIRGRAHPRSLIHPPRRRGSPMTEKIKATLPLAVVIGVLAFLWCEVALNFTFHWVTDGNLGGGLALPSSFHLVVPAAFVAWGFFFAAGADAAAFSKVVLASITGGLAAFGAMAAISATAQAPDFWGIALWVGIFAVALVVMSAVGDRHYVPATFGAFASVFFWWNATGLDGWSPGGGGKGNSVAALKDAATAGTGAFGGVLSTPYGWVWASVTASLLCGCVLGIVSVKLTAVVSRAIGEPVDEAAEAESVGAHAHA